MLKRKKLEIGVTLVVWAVALSVIAPLFFRYWARCEITLDDRPFAEKDVAAVQKYLEESIWLPEKRTVTRVDGSSPPVFVLGLQSVNVDNIKWLLCEQMGDYLDPRERPWEGALARDIGIRFFPYLSPAGIGLMLVSLFGAFWIGRRSVRWPRQEKKERQERTRQIQFVL